MDERIPFPHRHPSVLLHDEILEHTSLPLSASATALKNSSANVPHTPFKCTDWIRFPSFKLSVFFPLGTQAPAVIDLERQVLQVFQPLDHGLQDAWNRIVGMARIGVMTSG